MLPRRRPFEVASRFQKLRCVILGINSSMIANQRPNRNPSLFEQLQDNCRYQYKSEYAGTGVGPAAHRRRCRRLCHASRRKGNQEASGESIEHHGLHS